MHDFFLRICRQRMVRGLAFCGAVALAILLGSASVLEAALVTFGFEATISEFQGDAAALNLPFSLAEGVQIEGRYIFQSEGDLPGIFPPRGTGTQGRVTLLIDGTEIEALANFGVLNDGGPVDINNPLLLRRCRRFLSAIFLPRMFFLDGEVKHRAIHGE